MKYIFQPHHARCYNGGNLNARYLRRETLLQYWLRNALAPQPLSLARRGERLRQQMRGEVTTVLHRSENRYKLLDLAVFTSKIFFSLYSLRLVLLLCEKPQNNIKSPLFVILTAGKNLTKDLLVIYLA
ncbi:MAG: hypothetical protein HC862_19070 [Scytonema sp. RU_4_4]|nr:hypothetical protein [Scytonema sp. RU_4_4]